ncbi:uncharacterized protein LOC143026777 [Oratosquilla oratoria]|uniref:uncharacterized protein LOC143026777 n=1 Tax=Oratosquilla oratoria TaxID=337810 RepID=UPI003F773AF1
MEHNDPEKHVTFSEVDLDTESRGTDSMRESEMDQEPKRTRFSDWFHPNKKLLSIKFHFLLRTSGTGALLVFLTLMMRQRGISPEGIGLIWTIMPVTGVLTGTLVIFLADILKSHRVVFIIANLITPIALSGVYWIPHIMPEGLLKHEGNVTNLNNSANSLGFAYDEKGERTLHSILADDIDQDTHLEDLIENAISSDIENKQGVPINVTPLCGITEPCEEKTEQQRLVDFKKVNVIGEDGSQDPATADQGSNGYEASIEELPGLPWFWGIVACLFFVSSCSFIASNLRDSICYMLLGEDGHLYGKQRLFGTIGWGICGLTIGALVDLYSLGLPEKDYFPGFIVAIILCFLDMIIVTRMEIPVLANEKKVKMIDLLKVIFQPRNTLFFATACILSASMSLHGTFYILLVEDVGKAWDPNFKALRTLQGLIMTVQCFGGEILVFHFAGDIMRKIGMNLSFVLVILSHALRYILYYIVTNPWAFLPIELLHGLYYGLLKSVITFHANELAPEGTTSTMFAALKIIMFGGKSLAGVSGGLLWSSYGGHGTFLASGVLLLLYAVVYSTISFVFSWLFCKNEQSKNISKPGRSEDVNKCNCSAPGPTLRLISSSIRIPRGSFRRETPRFRLMCEQSGKVIKTVITSCTINYDEVSDLNVPRQKVYITFISNHNERKTGDLTYIPTRLALHEIEGKWWTCDDVGQIENKKDNRLPPIYGDGRYRIALSSMLLTLAIEAQSVMVTALASASGIKFSRFLANRHCISEFVNVSVKQYGDVFSHSMNIKAVGANLILGLPLEMVFPQQRLLFTLHVPLVPYRYSPVGRNLTVGHPGSKIQIIGSPDSKFVTVGKLQSKIFTVGTPDCRTFTDLEAGGGQQVGAGPSLTIAKFPVSLVMKDLEAGGGQQRPESSRWGTGSAFKSVRWISTADWSRMVSVLRSRENIILLVKMKVDSGEKNLESEKGIENLAFDKGDCCVEIQLNDKVNSGDGAEDPKIRSQDSCEEKNTSKRQRLLKWLRPDRRLLGIKLHFLFRTMSTYPLLTFLTMMLRQRGVSPEGIGVIWTIMPAAAVVLGTLLSSLADYLKAHRLIFLTCNVITPIALSGVYWTPHVGAGMVDSSAKSWNLSKNSTSVHDQHSSVGRLTVPDNQSFYESSNFHTHSLIDSRDNVSKFSLDTLRDIQETDNITTLKIEDRSPYSTFSIPELFNFPLFWVIVFLVFMIQFSNFISSNLSEAICYMLLGEKGQKYGRQRITSSFSYGICALTTGSLIDLYSMNLPDKDYLPGFIMIVVFSIFDMITTSRLEVPKQEKKPKPSATAREFFRIFLVPKNVLFFVTALILGTSMNFIFTFHLLLVEDVAMAWDRKFTAVSTLQGLIVGIQAFFGQIPVMFFSENILNKIGTTWSISLVLFCHGIRCVIYYMISNPWVFLPFELLHGITYGLNKTVLTLYVNTIAPEGAKATMFAVLKSTHYAGKSLAGLAGSILWSWAGGAGSFLAMGLFILFYTVFFVFAKFIFPKFSCTRTVEPSDSAP